MGLSPQGYPVINGWTIPLQRGRRFRRHRSRHSNRGGFGSGGLWFVPWPLIERLSKIYWNSY
jgi:hypothetical protein